MNYLVVAIVTALLWLRFRSALSSRRRRHGLPYPPGPKPKPVIGNALDIPTTYQWLKAAEWKKDYGALNSI